MNILFLSRLYYPHTGGIEKHIQELGSVLIKHKHKIIIVTTKFNNKLMSKDKVNGVNIIRFKQPNIKYFGLINTWFWLFKNINLIKKSDIIHVHDVFIWYWPFKLLFPKKKVYITFHGQWGNYPITWQDKLQKKIGRMFSDGVISIGEYIDKNYGIKSDFLSYGATSLVLEKVLTKTATVLYVGRLEKSIPILSNLRALKNIKNFKIIFCGDGELKAECEKIGKVMGFVDPQPFYQKAKYVFASGYLTILEAMSNKCLIFVLYQNPLQKDYYELSPFKNFVVIAKNSSDLVNKYNYYQMHPKEAQIIIKKGYNWVKDETWRRMTDIYLKLWSTNQ